MNSKEADYWRPVTFANVLEGPCESEFFTSLDGEFVNLWLDDAFGLKDGRSLLGRSLCLSSWLRLEWELWHVVILADELQRSLLGVSNLQHGIWKWLELLLALFTEVVVVSHRALVSNTSDWALSAAITSDTLVNNFSLGLLLLLEVSCQQFLILSSAVFADLFGEDLLKILEELVSEPAGTVALLAWEAFLVDLLSIASEALWRGSIIRS